MTSEAVEEAVRVMSRSANKLVIGLVDKVLVLPDNRLREGLEEMKRVCYDDLVRLSEK